MHLPPDDILKILIKEYAFKQIKQDNGSEFDKTYKLQHKNLDHLLVIRRDLKNPKVLAIPLKHHMLEEHLNKLNGIEVGNISHHQGFTDFWKHIGTSPYNANGKIEPPAQHYGFSNVNTLKEFMQVILNCQRTLPINIDKSTTAQNQTEKDALIKARIGQGAYRTALLDYWKGCAVTECTIESLLVASHIKPWRDADDVERINPFNGLLLSPNLDRAFDKGLISFDDVGVIMISPKLSKETLDQLGISSSMKLSKIDPQHNEYLQWHRDNLFLS